ncbi:MAG: diguanylate cyclase [Acidiferrobacterales bacterium]
MSEHKSAASAATERILVVDDSLVIRKAIEKSLKSEFDIVLADNGETAWEIVAQDHTIKVLISDIEMPRLDGYGLICRIRAADQTQISSLPIIAITGAEDEETKARAFACGATDFIIKPIDRMQLRARVQAHVRFNDTTRKLAEVEATLEDQAISDPLTQLGSRRYFMQRGQQDVAHAVRHGDDLLLARLDVDHLKRIYSRYGDDTVDQLLVWLAGILKRNSRGEDTVARIGGAEFALIAPSTGREKGEIVCKRIRAAVAAEPFRHGDDEIGVTVSIGLVTVSESGSRSLEEMLELASRRLTSAKSEGGDRISSTVQGASIPQPEEVTLASPELPPEVEELLSIATAPASPLAELDDFLVADAEADNTFAVVAPERALQPVQADIAELLSLDRALGTLASGDVSRIGPWLDELVSRVVPLLELYNRERRLGLDQALEKIKKRLAGTGR